MEYLNIRKISKALELDFYGLCKYLLPKNLKATAAINRMQEVACLSELELNRLSAYTGLTISELYNIDTVDVKDIVRVAIKVDKININFTTSKGITKVVFDRDYVHIFVINTVINNHLELAKTLIDLAQKTEINKNYYPRNHEIPHITTN